MEGGFSPFFPSAEWARKATVMFCIWGKQSQHKSDYELGNGFLMKVAVLFFIFVKESEMVQIALKL